MVKIYSQAVLLVLGLFYVFFVASGLAAEVHKDIRKLLAGPDEKYEDGDNYSGTVIAELQAPLVGAPKQELFVAGHVGEWSGAVAYASVTSVTPEALRTKIYSGYSGICSIIVRKRAKNIETARTYPLRLNADDSVSDIRFFPDKSDKMLLSIGGVGDQYSQFSLYVLDLRQNKLRHIASDLIYGRVSISRDGRQVVYLRGVDHFGNEVFKGKDSDKQVQLCSFDTEIGKETVIAYGKFISSGEWALTNDNSILFGALAGGIGTNQQSIGDRSSNPNSNRKPSIFDYNFKSRITKTIVADAWRPAPSPSGNKIAFYGSEDIMNPEPLGLLWRKNPQGAALSVSNRDGSARRQLNREHRSYSDLKLAE